MLEHLLDHLGYDRVDVLGVSWGGGLAQQLAHQAPQRVRRLVLAATAPGVPGLGGVPGRPSALISMLNPRRYRDPDYLASVAGRLYGVGRSPARGALRGTIGQAPVIPGIPAPALGRAGLDGVAVAAEPRAVTLVLAGDDDPLVPVANGQILARLIRDARLVVVRGGGHLFLLQLAPEMATLIADFVMEAGPTD